MLARRFVDEGAFCAETGVVVLVWVCVLWKGDAFGEEA
jgi:hypothetical protein